MKKVLSLFVFSAMLALVGCGTTESAPTSPNVAAPAAAAEVPELVGEWVQRDSDGEDTFMTALIAEDTIAVRWTFVDDEDLAIFDHDSDGIISDVYWEGTYETPTDATDSHTWTSEANSAVLDSSLFGSTDLTKEFRYDDGVLRFTVSIQGESAEIEMLPDNAVEIEPIH